MANDQRTSDEWCGVCSHAMAKHKYGYGCQCDNCACVNFTVRKEQLIEVVVRMRAEQSQHYESWFNELCHQLRTAGIPILPDGTLERGSIARFNDPKDFGATIYRWQP